MSIEENQLKQRNIISTYAKHMILPFEEITNNISEIGQNEFMKYRYRHNSKNYIGDSDSSILLEKIKKSIEDIDQNKKILLLLSDGKDSLTLALAFKQLGVSCDTLTLLQHNDFILKAYIENVAKKLGHRPYFISSSDVLINGKTDDFLIACRKMNSPVLDQAFIYFLFGIGLFFKENNLAPSDYVIIDGLGNDEYFGYLPSKQQKRSYTISNFGLWRLLPRIPSLRWYIRSPAESHGDLSAIAAFFPIRHSANINLYFDQIPHSSNELEFIDFRAFCRGSFHDHQCMMEKTNITAKHLNSSVYFPWTDPKLANYCFNLPLTEKFNFKSNTNKLILRKILKEEINWNQTKRGVDLYLDLDVSLFKKNLLQQIIPSNIINKVDKNIFLPNNVKKRAYLELLNLYGYCLGKGMTTDQIEEILL